MKNKLLSAALMAAAVVVASCQKDETSPVPQTEEGEVVFIGKVEKIDKIDTKTVFVDDVVNIVWSKGDSIAVNGVKYVAYPRMDKPYVAGFVKCDAQENPSGSVDAFFPASIQVEGESGIFPEQQNYREEERCGNIPMFAHSDDKNLDFEVISGILAVKVTGDDIDKVKSIRVSAPGDAVSGAFYMEDGVAKLTEEAVNACGNVVLVCSEPVYTGIEEKTFFIAIPAKEYSALYIELSSDGVKYSKGMFFRKEDWEKFNVERNKMFPIEFKADDPTANCYIISSAESSAIQSFFKATKGNSTELLDVKSVKVLWESSDWFYPQEGDLVSDVDYSRGIITYTVNAEVSGNAVIAAYDNSSLESGNIIWSWHIWISPGYNPDATAHIYNNSAGRVMDRNLGATADGGYGLLYQWGRKDPFLGSGAASTFEDWDCAFVQDNSADDELNLRYAIQNPTTFILNGGPSNDWYCVHSPYKNDYLWKGETGEKTIYDPCPVGWRVPDGGSEGLWATAFGFQGEYFETQAGVARDIFDFANTKYKLVSGGTCLYPLAGARSRSTGGLVDVGEGGYCWSSTPCVYEDGTLRGNCLFFRHTSAFRTVYPSSKSPRASGLSVRCVEE